MCCGVYLTGVTDLLAQSGWETSASQSACYLLQPGTAWYCLGSCFGCLMLPFFVPPLFLARDTLLMTTVTLLTFVSGVPTTVHWVICFSVFFDEGASRLFVIFYDTLVTMCTTSFVDKISTFCPHSVYTHFVWISEQTSTISLYIINWLVCITETECVYCAVRTGYLNVIWVVCFIWIWEQTAIISLYSINWLVCITEM